MNEYANRKPGQLSGGQQQRAALASFDQRPGFFFLDEPTSGLDDENTNTIKSIITHKLSPEVYCIVASHDARLNELADEIIDFDLCLSG